MRASILCFVIASVLIAVCAQTPTNPVVPNQFTCNNCTYTFSYGGVKYSSPGRWWYDAVANMNRQDYLDSSNVQLEFLEAIGLTGTGYVCWIYPKLTPPTCATSDIFGPISIDIFSSFYAGSGASYIGTEKVDGVQCDHWQVPGEEETYDLWVQSSNVNNPIRLKETSFKGDYVIIDIHQLVPGKPQAGIFKIPSFCKTN